ncbi:helix-hairpin-helix domain-containing protein [Halorubrum sp. BV1]|uniref:helix-hairpin-helix domain-containing protein n=1 Tax=Halorubrum sp. BV1 TaxID=1498500 RepID=UPI000679BB00|nr:helix-hairpin-helix domain-containing protein [Halorubrum sp. BV1]
MALLQKIKEALGFGSAPAERDEADTEVTVEHEPDDADAEPPGSGSSDGSDGGGQPVAAETDAAASTGALVDEDGSAAETEEAAEPAEAAEGADEEAAVDDDDVGPGVENITGIGPAYAERLAGIGIETIDQLAAADAADVAERTSVGETRAATWIERANEF